MVHSFLKKFFLVVAITLFFGVVNYAQAATFTVNSTLNTMDSVIDGTCADGSGNCTLYAAIQEANATVGADTITITATGTVTLDTAYQGIADQVTITGPGSSNFIIDSTGLDTQTIFSITSGGSGSSISGIGITNIYREGVFVASGATDVTINSVSMSGRGVDTDWALVDAGYATRLSVQDSTLSSAGMGVRLSYTTDAVITGNTIEDMNNVCINNTVSSGTEISNNTASSCANSVLYVVDGSNGVTVSGNTFTAGVNGTMFIGASGANSNITISDNTITGSGSSSAISIDNHVSDITITGNTVTNFDAGIYADGASALTIGDGTILGRNIINTSRYGVNLLNTEVIDIKGNYFGVAADGTTSAPNELNLYVRDSAGVTVGGLLANQGNYFLNATTTSITFDGVTDLSVLGNVISNSTNSGIQVIDGTTVTIKGNWIGLTTNGTAGLGNGDRGIDITSSSAVTIGGTTLGEGNIISANKNFGIHATSITGLTMNGNYFGFESTGTSLVTPNGDKSRIGLYVGSSSDVIIGGTTSTSRNYFADNGGGSGSRAIHIASTLTNASIIGNYIGVNGIGNPTGSLIQGIVVSAGVDGSTLTIGGTAAGEGNLINSVTASDTGMAIQLPVGINVKIYGNKIGTNPSGVPATGYQNDIGIAILSGAGSMNNKIGGVLPGQGNTIAGSTVNAILILNLPGSTTVRNSILGNKIYQNTGGTDLTYFNGSALINAGPTPNDAGDADTGPNDYLNTPVINSVDTSTGLVTYTVDVPAGTYRIEFFKNPTSGTYGGGETFIGYDTFTSTGTAKSRTKIFTLASGDFITGTTTEDLGSGDYGSTSEFSQAYDAGGVIGTPERADPILGCMDAAATNYNAGAEEDDGSCTYPSPVQTYISVGYAAPMPSQKPIAKPTSPLGSGVCPAEQQVHQTLKVGMRDGKTDPKSKLKIKEVALLQSHINRILVSQYHQAAGPTDGVFGPKTKVGVQRLQQALNTILKPTKALVLDGIVGPQTRAAINNSCGDAK